MTEITFDQLPEAVSQVLNKLEKIEQFLLDKGNKPQPEPEELLTVQGAAKLLNLSVPTIYGLTMRAEIPVCKRGKRLYFSKQELTQWIKAGRKKSLAETRAEASGRVR